MQHTDQKTTDKAVDTLNGLIETARDGENGFKTAADGAESTELKRLFSEYSAQRGAMATELSQVVATLGGEPHETGHVAGALHRGWINIKTAVAGNDDKAILEECERGEDYAKQKFTEALKEPLPANVRAVVERMAADVKQAHDRVRDLRDAERAKAKAD